MLIFYAGCIYLQTASYYTYMHFINKTSLELTELTKIFILLFTTKHIHNVPSIFHTQTRAEANCKDQC